MADIDAPLSWRMQQDGYLMQIDQLRSENTKLLEQLKYERQTSRSRLESIGILKAENVKLRELVASVWRLFAEHGAVNPCDLPEVDAVRNDMRELGVEV